jgi:uncharacterized protein (TIGR02145 family)
MTTSNEIRFSIPAAGLTSGGTMQSATTALCNGTAAGTTVNLTDTRDSKAYRVRKMAYGRCWMIDNLAFRLDNTNAPAYHPTAQLVLNEITSVNNQAQYALNITYTTNAGQVIYLYNWCAAMGDTSTSCITTRFYTANQPSGGVIGICPAPFRLPIGGAGASTSGDASTTNNEFAKLDIAMGGTGQNRQYANTYSNWMGTSASSMAWGGVLSGRGSGPDAGTAGYWWSSTAEVSLGAYHLVLLNGHSVYPAEGRSYNYVPYAVRCIL